MKVIISYKHRHAKHSVKITDTFIRRIELCVENYDNILIRRKLASLFHFDKLSAEYTEYLKKEKITITDAIYLADLTQELRNKIKRNYGKKALAFAEQYL